MFTSIIPLHKNKNYEKENHYALHPNNAGN